MIETDPLEALQERYGAEIDRTVSGLLTDQEEAGRLYGMMRYQFGFADEALKPVSVHGGKRFRPALCLLSCEGAGHPWRQALSAAAAIELLHNFSLIHDDIEDHDPARRHRPTVWKLWGEAQAINVGDAVFAIAGRTIVDAHPDPRVSLGLTRRFHEVTMRLTEGQYLDMSFETRDDVTAEEYVAMIERKSGALIAFSTWSGAFLAGTDTLTSEALHTFGMCLGRAFQMRDDLLGIWAARQVTGKEPAGDLANRKKTLPVLIAWERSAGSRRQILSRFFSREHEDVDAVKDVLNAEGAREETVRRGRAEMESALRALSAAHLEPSVRDRLELVARTLSP